MKFTVPRGTANGYEERQFNDARAKVLAGEEFQAVVKLAVPRGTTSQASDREVLFRAEQHLAARLRPVGEVGGRGKKGSLISEGFGSNTLTRARVKGQRPNSDDAETV